MKKGGGILCTHTLKNSSTDERLKDIDVLKAFGIIIMIMGHEYYGETFDIWLHSFHMPMFFIISGFLYKSIQLRYGVIKKIKSLLVPYVTFSLIHLILMFARLLLQGGDLSSLLDYTYHVFFINTEGLPICGAIWFLTALFFVDVFYLFIDNLVKKEILKLIIVITISAMGILIPMYGIRLPYAIDVAMMGVGLFYIGCIIKRLYIKYDFHGHVLYGCVGVLLCIIPININGMVNLRLGVYGNVFLFFLNAIVMTFSLYNFAICVTYKESWFLRELSFIGKNSIIYLGFNQLVLSFLKQISFDNDIVNLLYKIIALFICLVLLHLLVIVFSNRRFKFLIGK